MALTIVRDHAASVDRKEDARDQMATISFASGILLTMDLFYGHGTIAQHVWHSLISHAADASFGDRFDALATGIILVLISYFVLLGPWFYSFLLHDETYDRYVEYPPLAPANPFK